MNENNYKFLEDILVAIIAIVVILLTLSALNYTSIISQSVMPQITDDINATDFIQRKQ